VRGIHAYRSAEKNSEWLTMKEAAKLLRVTSHAIRRLIKTDASFPPCRLFRAHRIK